MDQKGKQSTEYKWNETPKKCGDKNVVQAVKTGKKEYNTKQDERVKQASPPSTLPKNCTIVQRKKNLLTTVM